MSSTMRGRAMAAVQRMQRAVHASLVALVIAVLVIVALVIVAPSRARADGRRLAMSSDSSIALGNFTGATEVIFPFVVTQLGVRFALEADPVPQQLRTCWMAPTPSPRLRTVRNRCSSMRLALVPQASVTKAWVLGDEEGMMMLAGARLDLAIHYLVPKVEIGRFSLGARGGLFHDDHGTHPAWDAAFGMSAGHDWTFGWEVGVASWTQQYDRMSSTAWFARVGLLIGTRL